MLLGRFVYNEEFIHADVQYMDYTAVVTNVIGISIAYLTKRRVFFFFFH